VKRNTQTTNQENVWFIVESSVFIRRQGSWNEKNYGGRGQRTPQSRTTEETMFTTRYNKPIRLKKEDTGDRKKWRGRIRMADPIHWEELI